MCLKCSSKGQGEKEMYTLGITAFPIPGEPGFPPNAMYAKPANKQEDGKELIIKAPYKLVIYFPEAIIINLYFIKYLN